MPNWWKQVSDLMRGEIDDLSQDARSMRDWIFCSLPLRTSAGSAKAALLGPMSVSQWLASFRRV